MLIAPKDSKLGNVTIGPGFDLAKLVGDGKIAIGDVNAVPAGKYAKAALEKLGVWPAARAEIGAGRECACRADAGRARRGHARDRLCHRRQGRAGVKVVGTFPADSHPPIIYPVAVTDDRETGSRRYLAFLRIVGGQGHLRKIRLHVPDPPDDLITCSISRRRMDCGPAFAAGRDRGDAGRDRRSASPSAWLLARRDFWGKSLLDALVHLPLVLPPVVTGYLLLLTFGRRGPVGALARGAFGIVFAFRWTGAALACGVMGFPLLVRPIRLSIEAVDRRLEQAAGTLGAEPWRVFVTVTLPLALPGVLAGMVLAFAKAIGEFGATITFVSNIPGETQTMSSAIYSLIQMPDGDARRCG